MTTTVNCRHEKCQRTFSDAELERRHHYVDHMGLQCDLQNCSQRNGYGFSAWQKLKAHIRVQHAEPTIRCPKLNDFDEPCDSVFVTEDQLRRHDKRCHGPKVYACPYSGCDHRTRYAANIKLHVNARHTQETRYWCPDETCDYVSSSRSSIARHHQRWHVSGLQRNRGSREREVAEVLRDSNLQVIPSFHLNFSATDTQKKRILVDFVVLTERCTFLLEVDEWQHTNGYEPQDEIMRMKEAALEIQVRRERNVSAVTDYQAKVIDNHAVLMWVRYNPAPYPFSMDGRPCQLSREFREARLVHFLRTFVPKENDVMNIVYMFYDSYFVRGTSPTLIPNILKNRDLKTRALPHLLESITHGKDANGDDVPPSIGNKRPVPSKKPDTVVTEQVPVKTRRIGVYPCRFGCPMRVYQTESSRINHEKSNHPMEYDASEFKPNVTDNNKTYCDECQTEFYGSWNYRRHYADAHTREGHVCGECSRIFSTTGKLQAHVDKVHQNKVREKPHQCNQTGCEAAFHNKSDLVYHMAQEHQIGQMTAYKCMYCVGSTKTYRSITNLNKHLRKAHEGVEMFTKSTYVE